MNYTYVAQSMILVSVLFLLSVGWNELQDSRDEEAGLNESFSSAVPHPDESSIHAFIQ